MERKAGIFRNLAACLSVFALAGCDADSFPSFMKEIETGISSAAASVLNYDYRGFADRVATAFRTARRDRYAEVQELSIETPKDTQLSAYTGISADCAALEGCGMAERSYRKNTAFPGNDTARLRLVLPAASAQDFVASLMKYGNISRNNVRTDDYMEKDMVYYSNELLALRELQIRLSEGRNSESPLNIEKMEELERMSSRLNARIMNVESNVEYLGSMRGRRLVDIRIVRESNSVIALVKSNLQNAVFLASGHMHWFMIAAALLAIWKTLVAAKNMTRRAMSRLADRRRARREALRDMPKITPKL